MAGASTFSQGIDLTELGSRKRRRELVALLLIICTIVCVLGVPAMAQEPGAKDTVGAPSSYITLRSDDLMVGTLDDGENNLLTYPYESKIGLVNFANPLNSGLGIYGFGNSISGAGHILPQDRDQVVNVGRTAKPGDATCIGCLGVSFEGGGQYLLPTQALHQPIPNAPDQISLAVGDLDKIPDANGVNHDELVIAYATGVVPQLQVRLAVLNFTKVGADGGQPLFDTEVTSPNQVSSSYLSPI